jgi:hypothetical protein
MKYFKTVVAPALCLVAAFVTLPATAKADDWNKKTIVTFSGPVEIPGVHAVGWGVLPAGTYVFKMLDSQSDRHIVQIFSQDEKTVHATILAIPNYRLQVTDKTVITFTERAAGEPEALRAWFYPGRNSGEEFVYPKARAMALAKASKTPVLFTPVELPVEVAEPIRSTDSPVVAELKRAPIKAVQPTGEEVELAQVVTPPPAQPEPTVVAQARPMAEPAVMAAPAPALPETASHLPQFAAIGFLALASALAIRTVRKRNA